MTPLNCPAFWPIRKKVITISQCLDFADLSPNEIILGPPLTDRHYALLSSYRLNLARGAIAVRDMIIADLRSFLDLGARQRAADLLVVLRLFLSRHPEALCCVFQASRKDGLTQVRACHAEMRHHDHEAAYFNHERL